MAGLLANLLAILYPLRLTYCNGLFGIALVYGRQRWDQRVAQCIMNEWGDNI